MAGDYACGPASEGGDFEVLDGYNLPGGLTLAEFEKLSSLSFVGDCTIRNFPQDNGIGGFGVSSTLLNFNLPGKSAVIVMDNVYYTGNMACSNLPPGVVIWWVNGAWNDIDSKCQDFIPPLDGMQKYIPNDLDPIAPTTQNVGVPFTYTLVMPELVSLNSDGSYTWLGTPDTGADVTNIRITDDITEAATGAEMSYVGYTAYIDDPANPVTLTTAPSPGDKLLEFTYNAIVPAGSQLYVEVEVVLDVPAPADTFNAPGTQFINTAEWYLDKIVTNSDGSTTPVVGVPGMDGISSAMTIVAPDLTVTKSSPVTALNYGVMADFTIEAQNTGSSDAWAVSILDQFPDFPTAAEPTVIAGMCDYDPTTILSAEIVDADGSTVVKPLALTTDYTLNWTGANGQPDACQLTFTMTNTAGPIEPNQYLRIHYDSTLDDLNSTDGWPLTNTATATEWYNANSDASTYAVQFTNTQAHHEDSYTLYTAMSGYYFEKTVANVTTGVSPGMNISALPGDQLHYEIRLYNVDQTFNNVVITDDLDETSLDLSTFRNMTINGSPSTEVPDGSGILTVGNGSLDIAQGDELIIEFDIDLLSPLTDRTVWNQANMTADGGFTAESDDPYINGVSSPDDDTDQDQTPVYVESANLLTKANPAVTDVAIGEEFTYRIEITAPSQTPLYDVVIYDDVAASAADIEIVSATDLSGTWTLTHDGTSIWDDTSGIDIPAGVTVTIDVTMRLLNTTTNVSGLDFYNSAYYTFHRINDPTSALVTTSIVTTGSPLTVVEPDLTASTKTATFVTPATKVVGTDPATAGDVLAYTVTIPNNGNSTAFDTSVVDLLPADLTYITGSTVVELYDPSGPTTTPINTLDPVTQLDGSLVWGARAGDGTFDIPVGQELRLTYQATVQAVTGTDITNAVNIDWTSLDNPSTYERDGEGCPTVTAPDLYCYSPTPVIIATEDNTALAKQVFDDSYIGSPYTGTPVVRVGDTVTYELVLSLQDYTTQNVVVTDTLPDGMELVGPITYDEGGATFTYTMQSEPTTPATGLLTWEFGDIYNDPATSNGSVDGVDDLIIRYVARVVEDPAPVGLDVTPTTQTLLNDASLTYTGYDDTNAALYASAPVDVVQPQISTITKTGTVSDPTATGSGTDPDPYVVDIVNDSMDFVLEACNGGDAPAYGTVIADTLPEQLDLSTLTVTNVYIWDPVALTQTAAANTQSSVDNGDGTTTLNFQFNDPVDSQLCARVEYSIGFHTNVAPNSKWWNSALVSEYWSRDTLDPANDREYAATPASSVYMTNTFTPVTPTKTVDSPLSGEVTIGDSVSYTITVPGTPVNAEMSNVEVSDTLDAALIYDSASVEVNGVATAIAPVQSGQDLTWTIPSIPAGQLAVITLNAHVANSVGVDAGDPLPNSVSYTYDVGGVATPGGSSDPATATLRIIEPTVTMSKSVENLTSSGNPPVAGDVLRYTLQLDALGGVALDNFSDAFDISIIDDLSLGLDYQTGTATIDAGAGSVALADPFNVTAGDGVTTAEQLRWSLADGDDIDISEGGSLTITYDVLVLDSVVAGDILTNRAVAQWTGLDGDQPTLERDGSDGYGVEPNDYETAPQTTSLTVPDNSAFTKSVIADSDTATPIGTLRVGDTVDYRLDITLQEGTTTGITVIDSLDAGLEFDSIVSINGDTVADYTPPATGAGSNFTYGLDNTITAAELPTLGETGDLTFSLGDVTNDPLGDPTTDTLTIVYRARVATGLLAQTPTTTLGNTAVLTYNTTSTLSSSASVTVLQPVMSTVTKLGNGTTNTDTTPLVVNVATDTVQFTLESCNTTGLAPAYNVQLTDVLASQLDESSIANLAVTINGLPATDGVNYDYTPPAGRGDPAGLGIDLIDPVNAGQCVTVTYDIGFYTDLDPNELWSNSVTLDSYSSLAAGGQLYAGSGPATFWMTNQYDVTALAKELTSASEATIGDDVVYQITVPSVPVNAQLDNVVVTDTLHAALEYVSASALDTGGNAVTLDDAATTGQDVSLAIAQIPAGEQVIITLNTRVANNTSANAGDVVGNTAAYTYTGMTDTTLTEASAAQDVTIIEPELAIAKTVVNDTNPGAAPNPGNELLYTVTFTASGAGVGDNFSDAFDLSIEDQLSEGLAYVDGSETVDSGSVSIPAKSGTGAVGDPQTLVWSIGDGSADINVTEGSVVTLQYKVLVLGSVQPGQDLTNSATVYWTGQDDDNTSPYERNGSDCPGEPNDYCATASTTVTSDLAVTFEKEVVNVTTGQDPGDNASPGDTLRYTVTVSNDSLIPVTDVALLDELDAYFVPGTLTVESVSTATYNDVTDTAGGTNGTGLVSLNGMTLAPTGDASGNDVITVVFTAELASVIDNGTTVVNEAQLSATDLTATTSNQVSTLIGSAPVMEVYKTSEDITGDPAVLAAGDTLRYTITVKNIGTEDATGVTLHDLIPAYTTYVPGSTTLNGVQQGTSSETVSLLQNGMSINSPGAAQGVMPADADPASTANIATITFEVTVNSGVIGGTQIANQAYVNGSGVGSGAFAETPSDDPTTTAIDDPTVDVVGDLPLIDAQKTVQLAPGGDSNGNGIIDTGDVVRYTITVSNTGPVAATGVTLFDTEPAGTSYVVNTTYLNGSLVPDGGSLPLSIGTGIDVNSPDTATVGEITAGQSAVVTFDVTVTAASGTQISNQGSVGSNEQADEPTDADGIDSNGDQPTIFIVGADQLLSITKEVFDLNGGTFQAGDVVEYVVTVDNIGSVPAYDVVINDALDENQLVYVSGSATLNGSTNGVTETAGTPITTISADYDYDATNRALAPGDSAVLRFRATINPALITGTNVTNTADVSWDSANFSDSASISFLVGAPPAGTANVSGTVWHDVNYDKLVDPSETLLGGWTVQLYRNNILSASTQTRSTGEYEFVGMPANDTTTDEYRIVFLAPGAGANTAALGYTDSPFNDTVAMQEITQIVVSSGSVTTGLNLPISPNGVVYNSKAFTPVGGATLTMVQSGSDTPLPPSCFDDPAQQGQVTLAGGYYKFNLNFSDTTSCDAGGDYLIRVTPPASGYHNRVSEYIPPTFDISTTAYDVPVCNGDAVTTAVDYCEAQATASTPLQDADTTYYLRLLLNNPRPDSSQLFNNHIPVDPQLDDAVAITKVAGRVNVSRGEMVPYTITVNNAYTSSLSSLTVVDTFPAGFKYVEGSSRFNGEKNEPTVVGNQLRWDVDLSDSGSDSQLKIQLLFVVSSGVSEGEYVNRAQVIETNTADPFSGEATATVRVVPDPAFDCTDIIGKVFDDRNLNGVQDNGEKGLPNTRVITARGLTVTSDEHGRFHVTCAAVPNESRGSNFILKLDERSLPTGYRVTTENPRVQRITRGKMAKFNFGATIHRVVRLDVADGVFEPDSTTIRRQWIPRVGLLLEQLVKEPSILRISYLADVENESLVERRVEALEEMLSEKWNALECCYKLEIEREIYWRRGAPPKRSGIID